MNNFGNTLKFSHMQQPQDSPGAPRIEAPQTTLEAEMEKNRILRAALETKIEATRRLVERSRELSRLQASLESTTEELEKLVPFLKSDWHKSTRERLQSCILALKAAGQ